MPLCCHAFDTGKEVIEHLKENLRLLKSLTYNVAVMGVPNPCPHLDPDSVKSPIELERFRKKLRKVALHTALCVVCLGLAATKQFEDEDLRRIFLGVDLTQAEIERGINSYAEIEEYLKSQMIEIDVQNEDYCSIISDNSDN